MAGDFAVGRHEGLIEGLTQRVTSLEAKVDDMNGKLDQVLDTFAQVRGAWRAIAVVGAAAGAVLGAVATVVLGVAKLAFATMTGKP